MPDDVPDLSVVPATHAIDVFDQPAFVCGQTGIQRVPLVKAFERAHRHTRVQVVRAGLQNVAAVPRSLVGQNRIDVGVKEHRRESVNQCSQRFPWPGRNYGPVSPRRHSRVEKLGAG